MKKIIVLLFIIIVQKSFCQQPNKNDTTKMLQGWWVDANTTTVFFDSTMLTIWDTTENLNGETFRANWKYENGLLKISTISLKRPNYFKTTDYTILELNENYLSYQLVDNKNNYPPYRGKKRKPGIKK